MLQKIKNFTHNHRFLAAIIVVVLIIVSYFIYQKITAPVAQTNYVMAAVTKDTIVTSITGTGQVSNSNQVDLKSQVSSDIITAINVKNGQTVKAGDLLMQFDSKDAQKAVRDAQANLASAKISLAKLQQPTDQLSLTQAQNALAQAQDSQQTASDDLNKTYEDAFNTVANAFLDLPNIMSGLNDILLGTSLGSGNQANMNYYTDAVKLYGDQVYQYSADAFSSYQTARANYDTNFNSYKATSRYANTSTLEALVNQTYNTTKNVAQAVKDTNNLIQFYEDQLTQHSIKYNTAADTSLNTLSSFTSKTNTDLTNLFNIQHTIQTDKQTIDDSGRTITEKTQSLAKLVAGTDPLDIQSQQLAVQQRQNSLVDAQQTFANYFIRAPFDGVVAKIDVNKGDSISSGATVATLITTQQIAQISLNEVDVSKVKIGAKVTLTFDAIDSLTLAGQVIDIDTIGTVSQGVVTYNVKIAFDTQDDRVKPGMSVNASIITEVKPDVLVVPNSAIKTQGGSSYVEIFDTPLPADPTGQGLPSATAPRRQIVQVGLSNDTETEIVSGLNENDQVVTKTTTPTAVKATTSQAPSLIGGNTTRVGGGGSFGGAATGR